MTCGNRDTGASPACTVSGCSCNARGALPPLAACTAGRSRAIRIPMMAITTSSSINVKPDWGSTFDLLKRVPNPRCFPGASSVMRYFLRPATGSPFFGTQTFNFFNVARASGMPNEYCTTQDARKQAICDIIMAFRLSPGFADTDRSVAEHGLYLRETRPNQLNIWPRPGSDSIVRWDAFPTRMHSPYGGGAG